MAKMTLKYDFANDVSLAGSPGPTLALTRATTATVMDYFNVLKTVQAGEERYTGGRRVENLIVQSNNLTEWTKIAASAAQGATDPDGGATAWTVTNDGTNTVHYVKKISSFPAGKHTVSFYAKAGTASFVHVLVEGDNFYGQWNLATGAVANEGSGTSITAGEDVGNGFFRYHMEATATSLWGLRIHFIDSAVDSATPTEASSSTGILANVQIENVSGQDDTSPSEYQATTTAAVSKWYATKRRTNLCLQSEDFSTTWGVSTSTLAVVGDEAVAPDGTATADLIIDDSGGGTGEVYVGQSVTVATSTAYTQSVYVKANGVTWVTIATISFTTPGSVSSYFDLTNGVVGTAGAGHTSGIEDAGNGWFRCWITFTTDGADTAGIIRFYAADANSDVTVDRDGTSSIYVWGAQLEKGSAATAYIPTTTTVASSSFDTAITPTGLLVEEARTNICLYSEDLSDVWWNPANSVLTADAAVAPDGAITADDLKHSNASGFISKTGTFTVAADTEHTLSFYVKQGTSGGSANFLSLLVYEAATSANRVEAWYNLSTYATATVQNGGTGTGAAANIESVGNGWYRCSLSGSPNNGATVVQIQATIVTTDATFTRDVTNSLYVWGAQLEAGAFPTSYIPTAAASVTRNADIVSTTDVSWLNASAGSLYTNWAATYKALNRVIDLTDGTNSNRIATYFIGATDAIDPAAIITTGGVTQANPLITTQDVANGVFIDSVLAWEADDFYFQVDGGTADTDSSGSIPPLNRMYVGTLGTDSVYALNGHIAEIRYYDVRLDNDTLEALSNGVYPSLERRVALNRDLTANLERNLTRNLTN